MTRLFAIALAAALLLFPAAGPLSAQAPLPLPQGEAAAGEPAPDAIQKTIDLLQDDARRAEVVRLLKLMETLQDEAGAAPAAGGVVALDAKDQAAVEQAKGLISNLRGHVMLALRTIAGSGQGLRQSFSDFAATLKTLALLENVDKWQPYVLKVLLWGLACLLPVGFIMRKYGAPPAYQKSVPRRARSVLRHLLIVAGPNFVLIASILLLPDLSTTEAGVTASLATGFEFIHALIAHFFVTLSVLYIALRLFDALFTCDEEGRCLVGLPPALAGHFLHSLRFMFNYTAAFVFVRGVFMANFMTGALYSLNLSLLTLPLPIYLTARVLKLRRLVLALEYRADAFRRRSWPFLVVAFIWLTEIVSLVDPAEAGERFLGRLFGTVAVVAAATVLVKAQRRLMLLWAKRDLEGARGLLLMTDTVFNAVAWLWAGGLVLSLWGLPLGHMLSSPLALNVLGRAFTIVVTVVALVIFLRFSRRTADWLLSSREFKGSRNARTMLPLILTASRALAMFVAAVVVLERLGVNVGPILAGAGILSLGVGMGAQTLVKDVINGISILMTNTVSVGDYVTMGGQSGTVEFLGLRTVSLRDINGNLIIVPNSSVDSIINQTRDYSQEVIEFPAPYDADPDEMLRIITDEAAKLSADQEWRRYMTGPVEVIGITAFDTETTTIRLKVHAQAGLQWKVGRELRLRLKRRTLNEGYTSPWYCQNVFYYRGDPNYAAPKLPEAKGGPA